MANISREMAKDATLMGLSFLEERKRLIERAEELLTNVYSWYKASDDEYKSDFRWEFDISRCFANELFGTVDEITEDGKVHLVPDEVCSREEWEKWRENYSM